MEIQEVFQSVWWRRRPTAGLTPVCFPPSESLMIRSDAKPTGIRQPSLKDELAAVSEFTLLKVEGRPNVLLCSDH